MDLSFDATQRLFRQGRYLEIFTALGNYRRLLGAIPAEHRVLIAQVLQHTGDIAGAREIAERENHGGTAAGVRSRCEMILGMACRHNASVAEALSHYQQAILLAKEAKDGTQLAWSALHMFRLRAEIQRADELAATLHDVRRYVTQAADPHVAAYMHDAVALMDASAGRLEEARRHLNISKSLVAAHPNAWLEQVNYVASSYVSFYECQYGEALSSLEHARRLLPVVGKSQQAAIDCNLGHALMVTGKLRAARERFDGVIASSSGLARLGALDGLARVQLAAGALRDCEDSLLQIERLLKQDEQLSSAFAGRWTAVTRVQLLLRMGRWTEAVEEASSWLNNPSRPDDRVLACDLTWLQAEALARAGFQEEAIKALFSQSGADLALTRGQQASFFRAAAVLLQSRGDSLGRVIFDRARRVWSEHGNILAREDLERIERENAIVNVAEPSARLANTIANCFNVGYNPSLLGRELIEAVHVLHCSDHAHLVEKHGNRLKINGNIGQRILHIGETGDRLLTLVCEIPKDPAKAVLLNDILTIGRAAVELERTRTEERSRAALWPEESLDGGQDALFVAEEMLALLATARRIAGTTVPVLITGETGTGKEILARTLHAYSARAKGAFLPFNCSSTPKDTLDSQLFGHRRGAFTGATESFQGVIRAAAGGTLFLDEIGDMGLDVQPKLLRFLESSEIHPVGEAQPVRVDVRVIAATNAPLDTLVADGRFREDLFYRLNIVRLHVPPLRERRVEIPALAAHYLAKHAQEFGKGDLRLAEETMEYLVLYRWPGNVRQLANEMRRMAALAENGAVLMPEHLSQVIAASRRTIPASERTLDPTEVVVRLDQPMAAGVQHLERAMMQYALQKCGGHMEATASMLGLSRKGLYLKRQRFAIEPPEGAPPAGV